MTKRISRPSSKRWAVGAGAVVTAGVLAAAAVTLTTEGTASGHAASSKAHLAASACQGPAGAAYVADAGWAGFSAIATATCKVSQTYNVGDPAVPNDPGDYNYDSTDEAVAIHGDRCTSPTPVTPRWR